MLYTLTSHVTLAMHNKSLLRGGYALNRALCVMCVPSLYLMFSAFANSRACCICGASGISTKCGDCCTCRLVF